MWSWLLHRITGVILVFGLLYHFILMHFMGHNNYSYEAVMARLSDPWWKVFNIIFLLAAVYHGFYGLNGLVTEYIRERPLRKLMRYLIIIVPMILVFFGIKIVLFN